jgi:hypothetical protein
VAQVSELLLGTALCGEMSLENDALLLDPRGRAIDGTDVMGAAAGEASHGSDQVLRVHPPANRRSPQWTRLGLPRSVTVRRFSSMAGTDPSR